MSEATSKQIDFRSCTRRAAMENFLARINESVAELEQITRDVNWYRNNTPGGKELEFDLEEIRDWILQLEKNRRYLHAELAKEAT